MPIAKPKQFIVRIARVGTDTYWHDLNAIKKDNLIELLFNVTGAVAGAVSDEKTAQLACYTLAIDFLNEFVKDKSKFNLQEEIQKLPEMKKEFTIKEK